MRGEFSSREEFEREVKRIFDHLIESGVISREQFTLDKDRVDEVEGRMYATNLWELAESRRKAVVEKYSETGEWQQMTEEQRQQVLEAAASIGDLDLRLGLKLADIEESRAQRPDRRTRNKYLSALEEFLDKAAKSRPILGVVINPATAGFFSSALISRALRGSIIVGAGVLGISAGGTMAIPVIAGSIVGGVMAAVRRSRNLKFDRGMEQRREALGQETIKGTRGEIRRAAELRKRGFGEIAGNALELIRKIESGDAGAALEARALLEAQRYLRFIGRPADLIFIEGEEYEKRKTNIVSITNLKIALKKFEETNGIDQDRLAERVSEIIDFVKRQDRDFESYRTKESIISGLKGAVAGAVAGIVAQEITDKIYEFLHPDASDKITLIEYFLQGKRPHGEYLTLADGTVVRDGQVLTETVTMPKTGEKVELIHTIMSNNGKPTVDTKAVLPEGCSFDRSSGRIIFETHGARGRINESWSEIREAIANITGGIKGRVSWTKFAHNGTPAIGSSYGEHFNPQSDFTELRMDYHLQPNGDVVISCDRAMGMVAHGGGRSFEFKPENLKNLVVTLSPHDRALQHDAIMIPVDSNGHASIPHEIASQFFTPDGKSLKNNMMVTISEVMDTGISGNGKTHLFSLMSDYNDDIVSEVEIPGIRDVVSVSIPEVEFHPEAVGTAPWAIPIDTRRPIGNPGYRSADQNQKIEAEQMDISSKDIKAQKLKTENPSYEATGIDSKRDHHSEPAAQNIEKEELTPGSFQVSEFEIGDSKDSDLSKKRASFDENNELNEDHQDKKTKNDDVLDYDDKTKNNRSEKIERVLERLAEDPILDHLYEEIINLRESLEEGKISSDDARSKFLEYVNSNFDPDIAQSFQHMQTENYDVHIKKLSPYHFRLFLAYLMRKIATVKRSKT